MYIYICGDILCMAYEIRIYAYVCKYSYYCISFTLIIYYRLYIYILMCIIYI